MIEGEIRVVDTLAELRQCQPGTAICDGRGTVGVLAGGRTVDGVHWARHGGRHGHETITFPVQAWWPHHPENAKLAG
ncbi:MAG: hypothetical protein ACI39C_07290 [Dietzia sp.]